MTDRTPTEIEFLQRSRLLRIRFEDGANFDLPCEYLRVFSRAADHLTIKEPVTGKEQVTISEIEPQGSYGLRLHFDDGHDTAIYSYETLYELGIKQKENWAAYLARLDEIGYQRATGGNNAITVTAIPFAWIARLLESDEEIVELPAGKNTAAAVLAILREKPGRWAEFLQDDDIDIEINAQPAKLDTPLAQGDEVTLLPKNPVAPAE